MNKRTLLFGAWALSGIALAQAQTDTLRICSHPYSVAEVGYSYCNGNFGQVTLPATMHTYNIHSESLQQLGKVSLYGKLSYAQQLGKQQSWNSMTGTYWQGVNLCDSTPGNQRAEQYRLTGAFALPLPHHWWIGAQFDYNVQQTAKDTDPRNRNQWMAWIFTPGANYRHGNLRMGVALRYASRKESVEIRNMGTHNTYPIFTAYPLGFFKIMPQSDAPNWYYTGYETGGALQVTIDRASFHLFQQLSVDLLRQEVLSNRVLNRRENETEGWQMRYRTSLQHEARHIRHQWAWEAVFKQTSSYAPLQRQTVSDTWEEYGRVLRSIHRATEGNFTYQYKQLTNDIRLSRFSLLTGIHYRYEKYALLFYPAEFTQPTHRFTVHATLAHCFTLPQRALLDFSVGSHYSKGMGTFLTANKLPDGETVPDIRLWQNSALQQQTFDYEIAPRWAMNVMLTYTQPVRKTTLSWYVRLSGEHEQAPRTLYPVTRDEITTCIGLLF